MIRQFSDKFGTFTRINDFDKPIKHWQLIKKRQLVLITQAI